MLANISYDLVLAYFGCSTVALPTPSGPVVARNMDWWPEDILAQCSYLIRCFRGSTFHFANAGWPGAIGVVTGLSARGFAVVLNAVLSPEGICKTGYPVLLHLRRVLEDAPSFEADSLALDDFAGARPLFAEDLIAFGTFSDFITGREAVEAAQWRNVWPFIRDFRWRLDDVKAQVAEDRLSAVGMAIFVASGRAWA